MKEEKKMKKKQDLIQFNLARVFFSFAQCQEMQWKENRRE